MDVDEVPEAAEKSDQVEVIAVDMKEDEGNADKAEDIPGSEPEAVPVAKEVIKEEGAQKPEKILYCAIPSCGRRSDDLVTGTSAVLTFYGVKDKASIKVCRSCLEKADEFQKKSVNALKNIECIFSQKSEPQYIDTIDIDLKKEPSTSQEPAEVVTMEYDRQEIESLVKRVLKRCQISKQVNACKKVAMEEATQLHDEMTDLEKKMEETHDMLLDAGRKYTAAVIKPPQKLVVQEVEINADGSVRQRSVVDKHKHIFANTRKLFKKLDSLNSSDKWDAKSDAGAVGEKALLPTPKIFPRVKPRSGDIVYAINTNIKQNFWLQAEIKELIRNEDMNQDEAILHYEPTTKSGDPVGGLTFENDSSVRYMRQVTLKEMAYRDPYPCLLPVGIRVAAKYSDENPIVGGKYYPGVIAEPAKASSKDRYLIFFDDGYAQYVLPKDVLVVCESSNPVWQDVSPYCYEFIRDYVTKYPEWPKIQLKEGQIVSTEWNGLWFSAQVLEVDCSLAKMRFVHDGREEWVYRGSRRFRHIYNRFNDDMKENIKGENPLVYDCDDLNTAVSNVSKKSTGGKQSFSETSPSKTTNLMEFPDAQIEYQGSLKKIKVPSNAPRPKDYVRHECNETCVIQYIATDELKTRSPLSIPLFLGWEREADKSNNIVTYRTPCGLDIWSYDELIDFLKATQSNLTLDLFCFDLRVNCLDEFVPARAILNIPDISYGKESVPIQCVNSLDDDTLPYITYTPERIIPDNLDLSETISDSNFLSCCDCTDDCEDKTKCACWKLTLDGVAFKNPSDPLNRPVGYEDKRLRDHTVSGIYECNQKCKCKKSCTNRVVQNGVQWPIQIFKTFKKGWGLRALFDMPRGSFICTYAGEILTDQLANEDGLEHGDEYFAQLDFIEINENYKDGYESDVTDIEDESDLDSPERKSKDGSPRRSFAIRRTDGQKFNLQDQAQKLNLEDQDEFDSDRPPRSFDPQVEKKRKRKHRFRSLFGPDEHQCYIIDAKRAGNMGRYFNHSCDPNVFVQNVFVNTHDLRLPTVAFFTNTLVKAGTELTWDYHYNIGDVPGKVLYCYCMSPHCRGRLL